MSDLNLSGKNASRVGKLNTVYIMIMVPLLQNHQHNNGTQYTERKAAVPKSSPGERHMLKEPAWRKNLLD